MRRKARGVLETHCGLCHRADLPTAKKEALAVFDLTHPRWDRQMTAAQLADCLRRLRERTTMSRRELSYLVPRGHLPPRRPSASEVRRFEEFVRFMAPDGGR